MIVRETGQEDLEEFVPETTYYKYMMMSLTKAG